MKYVEECCICPNCGTPLYKKSAMQDEDTKEKRFCGRCGFNIAAAKTEALKQLEEQTKIQAESCENTDESQNKDKVMAKKIFDLLLKSYAPDGISVRDVDEILRKIHEMFVCTTIVPVDDDQQD